MSCWVTRDNWYFTVTYNSFYNDGQSTKVHRVSVGVGWRRDQEEMKTKLRELDFEHM